MRKFPLPLPLSPKTQERGDFRSHSQKSYLLGSLFLPALFEIEGGVARLWGTNTLGSIVYTEFSRAKPSGLTPAGAPMRCAATAVGEAREAVGEARDAWAMELGAAVPGPALGGPGPGLSSPVLWLSSGVKTTKGPGSPMVCGPPIPTWGVPVPPCACVLEWAGDLAGLLERAGDCCCDMEYVVEVETK
jgi:hypothetical protein